MVRVPGRLGPNIRARLPTRVSTSLANAHVGAAPSPKMAALQVTPAGRGSASVGGMGLAFRVSMLRAAATCTLLFVGLIGHDVTLRRRRPGDKGISVDGPEFHVHVSEFPMSFGAGVDPSLGGGFVFSRDGASWRDVVLGQSRQSSFEWEGVGLDLQTNSSGQAYSFDLLPGLSMPAFGTSNTVEWSAWTGGEAHEP